MSKYFFDYELIGLNKSQRRSIERVCDYIGEGLSTVGEEQITSTSLEPAAREGEHWLVIKTEHVASPHSLLSALCNQYWMVLVGRRGRLTAHMYPDSYKQFRNMRGRVHSSGCRFVK